MYRSRDAVKSNRARTRTRFSLEGPWPSLGISLNVMVLSAFCCNENFFFFEFALVLMYLKNYQNF